MTTLQDPYDLVGQVLDGQFRVDRPIGEGGFSVVYRGYHVGLDEPVAIKCLKIQAQVGSALVEAFVRRFRDESKIHYRLSRGSLHIARTVGAGTTMAPVTGALVPYMVLEWLEGFPLAAELRARRERGERGRPLADAIRMLDPVAEAMAFAHSQGVVHRDLNPSNVFVAHEPSGRPRLKVLDFGVAKVISDHALALGPRAATLGLIRMFTPTYGAPEQFQESLGPIQPYTDVYAFALMLVELLIDRTPIEGENLADISDQVLDPSRRPTPRRFGVPTGDAVEQVMSRALALDPTERPSDVGEFWGMLKNAAARDASTATRVFAKATRDADDRSSSRAGSPRKLGSPYATAPSARTEVGEAGRYGYVSPRPPRPSSGPESQAPRTLRHGEPPPPAIPAAPPVPGALARGSAPRATGGVPTTTSPYVERSLRANAGAVSGPAPARTAPAAPTAPIAPTAPAPTAPAAPAPPASRATHRLISPPPPRPSPAAAPTSDDRAGAVGGGDAAVAARVSSDVVTTRVVTVEPDPSRSVAFAATLPLANGSSPLRALPARSDSGVHSDSGVVPQAPWVRDPPAPPRTEVIPPGPRAAPPSPAPLAEAPPDSLRRSGGKLPASVFILLGITFALVIVAFLADKLLR